MFTQLKSGFDTVLIDEAAQAIEVSTLIPLKYACRRLILVGDPSQLPATVFSEPAQHHNYEQVRARVRVRGRGRGRGRVRVGVRVRVRVRGRVRVRARVRVRVRARVRGSTCPRL